MRVSILMLLALSTHVLAESSDRTLPIGLNADTCTVDQKNRFAQTSLCSGNVSVTQGTLEIKGTRSTVIANANGDQTYVLDGNPVQLRQKLDGTQGWMQGHANRVTLTTSKNLVRMMGDANLYTDNKQLSGETLEYNTVSGDTSVTGDNGKHGVRMVFAPKPKNNKAINQ